MSYKNLLVILLFLITAFVNAQKTSKDSLVIYLNQAYDYYDAGNYEQSVTKGRKLLQLAFKNNKLKFVAEAYYILGMNDETIESYNEASDKYNKALKIAEDQNDSLFILDLYNALGNIASLRDKDYKKSEAYYLKGLKLGTSLDDPDRISFIINLCWDYLDNDQLPKIVPYLGELQVYAKEFSQKELDIESAKTLSNVDFIIGRYLSEHKDYKKAHSFLNRAIKAAEQFNCYEELCEAYLADSNIFKNESNIDSAFIQLEKYNKYHDLFLSESMLNKLKVEQVKLNIEEYERALKMSEKEQELIKSVADNRAKLNIVYLIVAVILLVSVFVIYRQNSRRKKLIENLNKKNLELKEAEKKAAVAAEAKSNFVSNISHELRTPLHGVIGITSLLLAEDEISSKNKKLLKSLKFSGDYLLGLINNVLLLSKIDRKKIKIQPRAIELDNVFNHIRRTTSYAAKRKHVKIHFNIDNCVPKHLELDESVLSEILINLIDNAVKCSENGNVWVTAEKYLGQEKDVSDKVFIRFSVKDDGIGIPKEKKKAIFEKFSQISSEESIMEGNGLGLSIVQSLLLQLGSDIHLESEKGKGALFYFDLLCKIPDKEEQDEIILVEADVMNVDFGNKKVLMVEDNEINVLVTKKFLSSYQIQLELASEGNSGWQKIQENQYDLILLDINIPNMNGYEIAQKTRAIGVETPIIAVTASELSEIENQVYEAGMNDILIKPFNKSSLVQLLSDYLN